METHFLYERRTHLVYKFFRKRSGCFVTISETVCQHAKKKVCELYGTSEGNGN